MDAFADVHDRAWQFLLSLGADIALVQEAIPPEWIRERFDVHSTPSALAWCSAIVARHDLSLRPIPLTPVLAGFISYAATAEVTLPDGTDLLLGSVHATAKAALAKQLVGLDCDLIRLPTRDVVWMSDVAHHGFAQLTTGRRFIVGGDWNVSLLFDDATKTWGREFYERAERDGWVETHLRLHGVETQTWLRKGNRPHMLDHVFCDEGVAAYLVGSRSLVDVVSFLGLSDHAPLIVDFDLNAVPAPVVEAVA